MNKYQEALDELCGRVMECVEYYDCDENEQIEYWHMNEEPLEKLRNPLQELIDRAAPKKLRESHYEVDGEKLYLKYKCPNGCNIQLTPITEKNNAYEVRYCPKCGQKIWSEYLDEELEISDKEWGQWNN